MDILDIITTVIEFSQKEEEFSDEIRAVRATLESLHLMIKQVDQHQLPKHMMTILNENLEDAGDLLKKVSSENTHSWWTTFKNMLPGSNLQKLKEKNQQLVHIINLLNLHLNALKSKKRVTSDFVDDDEWAQGSQPSKKIKRSSSYRNGNNPTQDNNLSISTTSSKSTVSQDARIEIKSYEATKTVSVKSKAQSESKPKRPAFKLKLLCDKNIGEALSHAKKEVETVLTGYWEDNDEATYEFHRYNFPDLPSPELKKMSKDHAIITATCCSKSKTSETENRSLANRDSLSKNEEDKENKEPKNFEYKYILKDQSLNGTYYLKNYNLGEVSLDGVEMRDNFLPLKKGEQVILDHGDIIALIVQKPKCDELIFGFQFLTC